MPSYEIDPELVLLLVLPPLLYSATLDSSYLRIRDNLRPIGMLSIGLVLFTTATVGVRGNLIAGNVRYGVYVDGDGRRSGPSHRISGGPARCRARSRPCGTPR